MTATNAIQLPAAPDFSVPSISAGAMLVDFSMSVWEGRKKDKKATAEMLEQKGAKKGAARVNKDLMPGCAELEAIKLFAANCRNQNAAITMPWFDNGPRLLTTPLFFKHKEMFSAMKVEFYRLVDVFIAAYSWKVMEEHMALGDLFNLSDYPKADELRPKFAFNLRYCPLPESGDWRVDISNEGREALKQQYEQFYSAQITTALGSIWERARDKLERMSERLDYTDEKDKKIFRDTLVTNVEDIADLMAACNVANDPHMEAVRARLVETLKGVTPEGLRTSRDLRERTKKNVDEIIAALPGIGL